MSHSQTLFHSIKSEIHKNLSISVPLIASQLIYSCSGFIGTALVARLGQDALAASVLVGMIWYTLTVLFFGLLNSISVLVSHQYGSKNYQAISEIMGQSFILGAIVSVLMILILLFSPIFLNFTDQPPAVIKLAIDYMYAILWTIPGLVILIIYEQFLAGMNRAKMVLRISLLVVPIEIPIIYILIFGKFGFPKLGVAGIGYGFAITYTATAIILTYYLLRSKYYRQFNIFGSMTKINTQYLKELIRIGLPMGFMHLIEVSTFAITTFWIARFGTTMLAAHQIAMQYLGFVITIVFAMSQAITVRVGHAVGQMDLDAIKYAVYVGMIINFIFMVMIAIAFFVAPKFFLQLDINIYDPKNAALIRDSATLLGISAVLMLFDNFRINGFGALRGLKDTKFPMYVAFVSFWIVALGFSYLFAFVLHLDGRGVWWGLTVGIAFGAVIVLMRLHKLLQRVNLKQLNKLVRV